MRELKTGEGRNMDIVKRVNDGQGTREKEVHRKGRRRGSRDEGDRNKEEGVSK